MFSRAVVTSHHDASKETLAAEAEDLKLLGVTEVVLTHVSDVFTSPSASWSETAVSDDAFALQMSSLEECDLSVTTEAPLGQPAISLREISRAHGAGLIVVDAEDGAIFGYGTSGDISGDLVARSETPVLVRPRTAGTMCRPLLSRILFATDFSETAAHAFATLVRLAGAGGGQIDLLHVEDAVASGASGETPRSRANTVRLGALRERLMQAGAASVETEIAQGSPLQELKTRAEAGRFTLVVLGSKGCSGQADGALGAVSGPLVRATRAPVLLVPPSSVPAPIGVG
jgi:nucleotide-binding universal stress UspA family protein